MTLKGSKLKFIVVMGIFLIGIVFLSGCTEQTAILGLYNIDNEKSIYSRDLKFDNNFCQKSIEGLNPSPKFRYVSKYLVEDRKEVFSSGYTAYNVECYEGGTFVGDNINYIYCVIDRGCENKIENNVNKGYERYKIKIGYEITSESTDNINVTTIMKGCAIEYKLYENYLECYGFGE